MPSAPLICVQILEFYAPWCGHCQNLRPAYEKVAKNLEGLAKVAAINCDDDSNKPFCGQMGVQGFPTLKIVKPGAKRGKPVVEDYQGPRTAKAIVDAVVDKIPNHVKKLQSSSLDEWLADESVAAKAILFTEKGTTSALLRSIAIDFLGSIKVGQIRSKETDAAEKYGITEFPSIVVIPGNEGENKIYSGDMKKQAIVDFLGQVASPNPDPAPGKPKSTKAAKSKDSKKSASVSSAFSEASEAHMSADLEDELGASTIILDDSTPTESPLPIVENAKPVVVDDIPPIASLATANEVVKAVLGPKKGTCLLVFLPAASDGSLSDDATSALGSFAQIADKHKKRQDNTFPFYSIPADNEQAKLLRSSLGLKDSDLEIIAVNNKRSWWRHFDGSPTSLVDLETFIDNIKLGEGAKQKLPAEFGVKSEEDGHSEL